MKKWYQHITCGLALLAISNVGFAGVSCHDFIGKWSGTLSDKNQTLQSVELDINDMFGDKTYGASIYYTTQDEHEDRLLNGKCHVSGDDAHLHLTRNVLGVNADVRLTLQDDQTLRVDSYKSAMFGMQYVHNASGTLKRQ